MRPPQPAGVADLGYAGNVKWAESEGPDKYRRGLYIQAQRTVPYPLLANFDAPDGNLTCSRRQRSTTPLQALNLLNDPAFVEAAQGLALRALRERASGSFAARLDYLFRVCLARSPSPGEKDRLAGSFARQMENLRRGSTLAAQLMPLRVESVDPVEAAAWVAIGRTLLNLDEFLERE